MLKGNPSFRTGRMSTANHHVPAASNNGLWA
nr:MAG TPA: hypothetical protein [Caudoviricetes sp.]